MMYTTSVYSLSSLPSSPSSKVSRDSTWKLFPAESAGTVTVKLKKALSWTVSMLSEGFTMLPKELVI